MPNIPLKLILLLNTSTEGFTYKDISAKIKYHPNTISKHVSYLYTKGLLTIEPRKSKNIKGRDWINVVKLKPEFIDENVTKFLLKIAKQLNCQLNDLLVS